MRIIIILVVFRSMCTPALPLLVYQLVPCHWFRFLRMKHCRARGLRCDFEGLWLSGLGGQDSSAQDFRFPLVG